MLATAAMRVVRFLAAWRCCWRSSAANWRSIRLPGLRVAVGARTSATFPARGAGRAPALSRPRASSSSSSAPAEG